MAGSGAQVDGEEANRKVDAFRRRLQEVPPKEHLDASERGLVAMEQRLKADEAAATDALKAAEGRHSKLSKELQLKNTEFTAREKSAAEATAVSQSAQPVQLVSIVQQVQYSQSIS